MPKANCTLHPKLLATPPIDKIQGTLPAFAEEADPQHDMPSFFPYKLAELRCADRIVHGRWILVIGQVIHPNPERKPAVMKLEPTLKMHIEIEIRRKARRIRSAHHISLRVLY